MSHIKKKKGERKAKEAGRGESNLEILLSAHARTLKAVIWHQEQKLVQCSTCEQRFGQFGFFSARQRPKNGLTRFERHFLANCPGVNGLITTVILIELEASSSDSVVLCTYNGTLYHGSGGAGEDVLQI